MGELYRRDDRGDALDKILGRSEGVTEEPDWIYRAGGCN